MKRGIRISELTSAHAVCQLEMWGVGVGGAPDNWVKSKMLSLSTEMFFEVFIQRKQESLTISIAC